MPLVGLGGKASHVSVLSRFFDAQPLLVDFVKNSANSKRLTLYTQNGITTLTKAWLGVPAFTNGEMEIRLCRYTDEEHFQQLHGKAYAFACGKEVVMAMGSANFTTAALRRTAANGNLEVLLCSPAIASNLWSPKFWFDPDQSSIVLRDANQLQTATDDIDENPTESNVFPLKITESQVEDDWLIMKITGQIATALVCHIVQGNNRAFYLSVETNQPGLLRCRLHEANQKRLRNAPALAQLGLRSAATWSPQSNPVLVTNLQDIVTGRDLRRERQIREARESPQRFMDVLMVLCSNDALGRMRWCQNRGRGVPRIY